MEILGRGLYVGDEQPEGWTPDRAQLPKSTVQARVAALGKLGDVMNLLLSQPTYFAQWFAPDWPNVFVDDAGLLQVLRGVGLTDEQIATITAAP